MGFDVKKMLKYEICDLIIHAECYSWLNECVNVYTNDVYIYVWWWWGLNVPMHGLS